MRSPELQRFHAPQSKSTYSQSQLKKPILPDHNLMLTKLTLKSERHFIRKKIYVFDYNRKFYGNFRSQIFHQTSMPMTTNGNFVEISDGRHFILSIDIFHMLNKKTIQSSRMWTCSKLFFPFHAGETGG